MRSSLDWSVSALGSVELIRDFHWGLHSQGHRSQDLERKRLHHQHEPPGVYPPQVRENPEEWALCALHKLKCSNGANDCLPAIKTFEMLCCKADLYAPGNGAPPSCGNPSANHHQDSETVQRCSASRIFHVRCHWTALTAKLHRQGRQEGRLTNKASFVYRVRDLLRSEYKVPGS